MEGNQIRGLMEAYSEVYQPSLITEEVVQEAADMWVEACIAYGIDFSEYTLDELTEAFIVDMSSEELSESVLNEILGMPSAQNLGASLRQGFGKARRAVGGAIKSAGKGVLDVAGAGAQGVVGQKTTSKNPLARLANATTRQATKVPRAAASFGAGFLTGKPGSTKPAPAAPAKTSPNPTPAAPAKTSPNPTPAKPTNNPSPAKPAPNRAEPLWGPGSSGYGSGKPKPSAPAKPAPGTKAGGPESIKPKTPNPLMKDMPGETLKKAQEAPKPQLSARAQAINSGKSSLSRDPRARAGFDPRFDKKPAPKPAPTPAVKKTPTPVAKGKPEDVLWHTDLFDIVKGHLLDEGYADTEESAIVIMVNMSEEWRESIVEGLLGSGSGFLGSNAAELGAKGGHDALPWNKNTKYTTTGRLRKPGENVRGERILNPPDKNKTTSAVTSDGKPR